MAILEPPPLAETPHDKTPHDKTPLVKTPLDKTPLVKTPRAKGPPLRKPATTFDQIDLFSDPALASFHPAVREWFTRKFPLGPTPPQVDAWPSIAAGNHTLVAAPTGSGKTLSAFLVGIDQLYKRHGANTLLPNTTQVLYVSPLKALAVDISENLEGPLTEIAEIAQAMGLDAPEIRVGVRSGDTTSSARASMIRRPPQIIVTTPESLYLLLTAAKSREVLRTVGTVIVDEIHAVARDKRGSHLSLTLERLDHVCEVPPVRIGLSATQRPIETIARLLVGSRTRPAPRAHPANPTDRTDHTDHTASKSTASKDAADRGTADKHTNGEAVPDFVPDCVIVDSGHQRELDLALELPESELEAVAPAEQSGEMLNRIAEMVLEHHTTIVFVNTRRMAERIAHQLAERLGDDAVAAHHGSLSKDRRYRIERRLRAGELKALVATASLELGIDIGPVELVCQIGSPRSLATFVQRVGRSGHSRHGTPKGRLFPMTRDELAECCALMAGVHAGQLDAVHPPDAPLDILAQQIVAETAAERWDESALFELVKKSGIYANLPRETFDEVVEFVNEGVVTGRGQRASYVHRDSVNHEIEGRRGARLASLTSGGAIPEMANYRVIAEPDDMPVGTVNEDWATESMPGDIFLLGTHSWRIKRVEPGIVRVTDAGGLPPTVPFWLGEAPARTEELSQEVSRIRQRVQDFLEADDPDSARRWVRETCGVNEAAAEHLVSYLAASLTILGALPTTDRLVIERFFDETGGMQLVVHSPHGGRINRGFGLALRKKFCVNFDFELQAAANDDAVLLSLGPQHSFALTDVRHYLQPEAVPQTLIQAVLVPPSPMFLSRWRWNLNRSLTVLRFKGGRKNPPPIQRMEADDVMAAVFPIAAGCQENVSGPIELPDHVLVRQTMHDTLTEAMDVDGLTALVERIKSGDMEVVVCDSVDASPLSHELLMGKAFTFLDDAEAIDRRSRTVPLRRGLPVELSDIGGVSGEAIARVCDEASPDVRNPDEMHDLLSDLVRTAERDEWRLHFESLEERGRAVAVANPMFAQDRTMPAWFWTTVEQAEVVKDLVADTELTEKARIEAVRGHLDISGPMMVQDLSELVVLPASTVRIALAALEAEGFAIQGRWRNRAGVDSDTIEWCSRRLLARIHVYSQKRRRRGIEAVTAQDFTRFLLRWHHLTPDTQVRGKPGLSRIIEQLQGYEVAAGGWEKILQDRVGGYKPDWLDALCLGGDVTWGRLTVRHPAVAQGAASAAHQVAGTSDTSTAPDDSGVATDAPKTRRPASPSRATPITLTTRSDAGWLMAAARGALVPVVPPAGAGAEIVETLTQRGALFHTELVTATGRLATDVEAGLWEAVNASLVTADSFSAVRTLLNGRQRSDRRREMGRRGLRRGAAGHQRAEGRWALLPEPAVIEEPDELAEAVAEQLLARWGVVFYDLVQTESLAIPWRDILWALRRLEARGLIRGGRFVAGFSGEQYALPEAVQMLKAVRKAPRTGERITVRVVDPCNITGVILPGPRTTAAGQGTITFVDGVVAGTSAATDSFAARPQTSDGPENPEAERHKNRSADQLQGPTHTRSATNPMSN